MGIIVDLIIVGIVLLSVFLGYKKGLVSLAIGLCAFVLSIVITVMIYKPVTNLIVNTTNIDETIQDTIMEKTGEIIESTPDNQITSELIESAKNGMLPEASRTLAINIVSGASIIAIFILIRIALIFITKLANAIAKLPIINQFNKMGGILYGLIRGILIIYVTLLIINFVGLINPTNMLHQNINESYIGKNMYENNILNVFFN